MGTRVAERMVAEKGQSPWPEALNWRAAAGVCAEVLTERARQEARWGQQNHPDGTGRHYSLAATFRRLCDSAAGDGSVSWLHILLEEVSEAMDEEDPGLLRAELIQISAVAAAWAEAIDRRGE